MCSRACAAWLLTPALLLIMAGAAHAHPLFSAPYLRFDAGSAPTATAIADLDADGRPDLVVTNSTAYADRAGAISIMLGKGDGTFGVRATFEVASNPAAVAIGDLNGDGRVDLVAPVVGMIAVILGNGDGTFGAVRYVAVGLHVPAVAIADFNADGRADLAAAGAGTVGVMLGNGDGTFGAVTQFAAGVYLTCLAVGDLNRDGRLDLVTNGGYDPNEDDYVGVGSVLLGNGDGTFGAPIGFEIGYQTSSIAVADFNGDGRPDLAAANFGHEVDYPGTVSVLIGNGDGTFGAQRLYNTGAAPASVAVADLNGDGRPDLATANRGHDFDWWDSNTVSVFLGNGDGTFRGGPEWNVGEDPCSVAIADLDADGASDVVTVDQLSNTVSVLLGNGNGTFGPPDVGIGGYPISLATSDFDADGRSDLAVASWRPVNGGTPVTVSVRLGNGDGTFRAGASFPAGPASPYSLASSDINADGWPDLVKANYGSGPDYVGTVSVWLGTGGGSFGASTNLAVGRGPSAVAVADLNNDGRPDLAVANQVSSTISVLLGNGNGTFGAGTEFDTGFPPLPLAIGDLNGDGHPDMVICNQSSSSISVLLGNGDGTFGAAQWEYGPYTPGTHHSLAIADLNSDGRQDVVEANSVRLGNGDGTFGTRIVFDPVGVPQSMAIADFEADGRLDIAGAHEGLGAVTVQLGHRDGTFGARILFGAGNRPSSLVSADFNGDGQPDLAAANDGSQTVSILLNRSGRVRSRERRHPAAPRGRMDGDLSVSWPVSIDAASDAGDRQGRVALAIREAAPNPSTGGRLRVEFSLHDGGAAKLELLDVAGRVVRARDVGPLGAGTHVLDLSEGRALRPGMYLLRLTQGERSARGRAVVLR